MARARKALTAWLPSLEIVSEINRQQIETFGGAEYVVSTRNFSNENSLGYILDAAQFPLPFSGGRHLYTGIVDKAAAIGWQIMVAHVFNDGNKRTGMATCELVLKMNQYEIQLPGKDEVTAYLEQVASRSVSLLEFTQWIDILTASQNGCLFTVR